MTGLLLAFKDWDAKLGLFGSPWTDYYGFGNFVRLFQTPELVQSIVNTLYFNVVNIIIEFPAPIILALLITEIGNKAFKRVTQTISYLPHFLSMAAVTGIVNSLLSQYGLVNSVLGAIFGDSDGQHIMSNSAAFLPVYVITNVWKNVGWGTIVYLAAICGLSEDLYEAAEIDGAGRFKQVMYITIPGIAPTIGILLILKMGSLFASSFELVYGLQNPVAWTQEVISTAVYKNGIGQGEYSISTALGLMQGIVALILTMLCCIVLGMGVPTTANYCIMAATCAPILIRMGVPTLAAHFFVFYFGIVADITPPVALAAYAGAAIAKADAMKTAINATKLAIAAFIVPYILALNPAMVLIDVSGPLQIAGIVVSSLVGIYGVSTGVAGYMITDMNPLQRIISICGGLMLMYPGTPSDIAGVVLVAIVFIWQKMSEKKAVAA